LADAGATVIVCEHREEYLEAVPGLYKVNLDGLVVEEVAIPELEPHLFGPQVDKLEVQGLTVALGGLLGALTLRALRRADLLAYLAEKK
jgi:hypothetical protein